MAANTPLLGDSDNVLLFKICLKYSTDHGGVHAPLLGDSQNQLLRKICQILNGV